MCIERERERKREREGGSHVVIYKAFCLKVAQGRMNETRTHSERFASLVCKLLHHAKREREICVYVYMHVCMYVSIYLSIYLSTRAHTLCYTHTHTHTHTHIYIYIYIYILIDR